MAKLLNLLRRDNAQSWEVQIEDVKNMLEDSGIAVFGTLNKNEENSEKELVKSITYPFYNKTLKDSKKLLIHLDTLEDVGLAESQVIIEALRDESSKEIEDILFSFLQTEPPMTKVTGFLGNSCFC